jgi:hypothetical protein
LAIVGGGVSREMGSAFLARGRHGPAWRVTLPQVWRLPGDIGRHKRVVAMGPCPILHVAPRACHPGVCDPGPGPRAGAACAAARGAPRPCPRQGGACGRVRHALSGRGAFLALHARAAHREARAGLLAPPRRLAGTLPAGADAEAVARWNPAHQPPRGDGPKRQRGGVSRTAASRAPTRRLPDGPRGTRDHWGASAPQHEVVPCRPRGGLGAR